MKINVDFEGLELLTEAELKAALVRFTEARDSYVTDGRAGMGALFNGLLIALDEERACRGGILSAANFYDDDDDFDWIPEI